MIDADGARTRHPSVHLPLIALAFVLVVGPARPARALEPHVQAGLDYLVAMQNGDGSWGGTLTSLTTIRHSTTSVADTLRALGQTGTTPFTNARTFLQSQNLTFTESVGRKIISLSGLGIDISADVATLLPRQNADGGWGAEVGFASDVLDTALAVRGLFAAGFPHGLLIRNETVTSGAFDVFSVEVPSGSTDLNILLSNLAGTIDVRIKKGSAPTLADGFFHVTSAPALIHLTSASPPALQAGTNFIRIDTAASATYSLDVSVVSPQGSGQIPLAGLKYLLDGRNADGGWGFAPNDADSRVFFSAEAAEALVGVGNISSLAGFLTAHHNADGGFGDASTSSAFETALAIRALGLIGVDASTLTPSPVSSLSTGQLANGSWNDDPYSTALALRALPQCAIAGSVALQGRPAKPSAEWSIPLQVSLNLTGQAIPILQFTPTTDQNGTFIIAGIAPGTYDIHVKGSHTLRKNQTVALVLGSNPVNVGTLREGDANNNNFVTVTDFSILATTFGKCQGTAGYDARADFNQSGCVTIQDFSLLATNFGQAGDP